MNQTGKYYCWTNEDWNHILRDLRAKGATRASWNLFSEIRIAWLIKLIIIISWIKSNMNKKQRYSMPGTKDSVIDWCIIIKLHSSNHSSNHYHLIHFSTLFLIKVTIISIKSTIIWRLLAFGAKRRPLAEELLNSWHSLS